MHFCQQHQLPAHVADKTQKKGSDNATLPIWQHCPSPSPLSSLVHFCVKAKRNSTHNSFSTPFSFSSSSSTLSSWKFFLPPPSSSSSSSSSSLPVPSSSSSTSFANTHCGGGGEGGGGGRGGEGRGGELYTALHARRRSSSTHPATQPATVVAARVSLSSPPEVL